MQNAERCTFTIVLQIRHSTWILSVSASLWTLTLWSCPLARFLALARKTSASLLCCSLYLMSKCPLEQRAFDFSTGFYMVKSHRLTTVHIWDKQKHQHATEVNAFLQLQSSILRGLIFCPLWNKTDAEINKKTNISSVLRRINHLYTNRKLLSWKYHLFESFLS